MTQEELAAKLIVDGLGQPKVYHVILLTFNHQRDLITDCSYISDTEIHRAHRLYSIHYGTDADLEVARTLIGEHWEVVSVAYTEVNRVWTFKRCSTLGDAGEYR